MKAGDLIKTACLGPMGSIGEIGFLLDETWEGDCWEVYIGGKVCIYATVDIEVII